MPGYHIEDQRPGTKKCGHQGGKVLVAQDEQNKRLNAARFQLDVMGVPGIIVARTDAEAANLIDGRGDERDQPFLVGATNRDVPAYKPCFLALIQHFHELGVAELNGHLLYAIPAGEHAVARNWLERRGILAQATEAVASLREGKESSIDAMFDRIAARFLDAWEDEARLKTFGEAVAEVIEFRASEGEPVEISVEDWRRFAARAVSLCRPREGPRARRRSGLGLRSGQDDRGILPGARRHSVRHRQVTWRRRLSPTCSGWRPRPPTSTTRASSPRLFTPTFPDKMLAYNLSPSFSWDTTGMSDEEMRRFPEELGKLGFVFNFITYGGHQIDGLAVEEFATALQQDGMLALARLQRKLRMVESPYRTPQTLVGGPRADAALAATSGRTATTMAMGKGSTQHQHLVQTEVPKKLLEEWLAMWTQHYELPGALRVQLRPHRAGSELLELGVYGKGEEKLANVIFAPIHDRRGRSILSMRDQNTFAESLRKKRLMTLVHLFLVHRFKADSVHYVTPNEDNQYQVAKMKSHGIFREVNTEVGQIIVADVDHERISELLAPDQEALRSLICKER